MRKIITLIFVLASLSIFSQNGFYKGWGFNGDQVATNTAKIGTLDNRSVYFINNDSIWGKRDSVGRLRIFASKRSTSIVDQTWERWAIKGAAYTGSFGAVYDGFWIGTTSGHNLNLFTRGNLPAITISSLTSGAVNAVKINPTTYTHSAQLSVNAGGGDNIFEIKNSAETSTYVSVASTGTAFFSGTVNIGPGTYGTDNLHQVRVTKGTGTVDIGEYASGRGAIWCNQTPGVGNFQVSSSANGVDGYFNGSSSSRLLVNGSIITSVYSYGMVHSNRHEEMQGADVASVAGAITLGNGGNTFELTGINAVTLISSTNWVNGSEITLIFTSTASLTDGVANSGTDIGFELAGNVNFNGSSDDSITLILSEIGGTQRWREKCRSVN